MTPSVYDLKKRQEQLDLQTAVCKKELKSCGDSKVNLEKRLKDVQGILHTLDTAVEPAAAEANRRAERAEERRQTAFRCPGVAGADIRAAYPTKGVRADSDTAAVYKSCQEEETRLINGIKEIESRINALEYTIEDLKKKLFWL